MSSPTVTGTDVEGQYADLEQHLLQWWGRDGRVVYNVITMFIDLGREYGKDKLYEAIKIAALANVKSFRFVRGILLKSKPAVQQKNETHGLGFVEVICCKQSEMILKADLLKNQERNWICAYCGTAHAVKSMLEKEIDGRIILI